ncbi:hypothetical protein BJF83_22825 [Nocardiopsis sp. CNR-923]|nr:hypothetical protein BJF83_22825 [Nocardiopsis sp. CNR-923]
MYPLVIEAVDGDGQRLGAQYTFLPYTGEDGEDVPSVDIAWVWPLMARPQRADDDTFLGGALSGAVGEDGRLGRLLEAGAQRDLSFEAGDEDLVELLGLDEEPTEATAGPDPTEGPTEGVTAEPSDAEPTAVGATDGEDDGGSAEAEDSGPEEAVAAESAGVPVTWAVDPATLDDVVRLARESHDVLDDPGAVSEGSDPGREERPADVAAQVWLREARAALAEQTVIATPYASVDLASLLRNGMDADAAASLEIGRSAVERALGVGADGSFALPADGLMDEAVYEFLSVDAPTGSSWTRPPSPPRPTRPPPPPPSPPCIRSRADPRRSRSPWSPTRAWRTCWPCRPTSPARASSPSSGSPPRPR